MKSIDIKKVGTIAAGAAMIGATLATPVLAGMDPTGIDKGFFYDSSYKPTTQIVVGEKANAGGPEDFVTAGNIAATIGNLAYMEESATVGGGSSDATGKVLIETAATGAIGEYVQDSDVDISAEFYDKEDAASVYMFGSTSKTYEPGDFSQYQISCDTEEISEATILQILVANNIHCLFCHTLCLEALENPAHKFTENLVVDSSLMWYYESGFGSSDSEYLEMAIDKDALVYQVEGGWIPMERLFTDGTSDSDGWVDFEYRGKFLFFGKEYYVKEIEGDDKIILAEGTKLDDITSEGYTSEYNGYKFKIDHLIYSGEYVVAGILLTIQKPDGTEVQRQISKMGNAVVDDLEISGVYAESSGGVETASIIVYNIADQIVLEDGEELSIGGEIWEGWDVGIVTGSCQSADPAAGDCPDDISQYDDLDAAGDTVLALVTVTLTESVDETQSDPLFHALRVGDEFDMPGDFKVVFKGYMTTAFREAECSGAGEGNIMIGPGDEDYQVVVSMTDDRNNRYDVRLDNGPFEESGDEDAFVIGGNMYQFIGFEKDDEDTSDDNDDSVEVDIKRIGSGQKTSTTLQHMCDMENDSEGAVLANCEPNLPSVGGVDYANSSLSNCSCDAIDTIDMRGIALSDAWDDDCDGYANDENYTFDAEDLYWANATIEGIEMILWFDDDSDAIILTTLDPWTSGGVQNQTLLLVDPAIVNPDGQADALDDFENDGSEMDLWVARELDLTMNQLKGCGDAENAGGGNDLSGDGDNNDLLIYAGNEDGETVLIDMSDRNQDDTADSDDDYEHSVGVYESICYPSLITASNCTNNTGNWDTGTWNCTNVTFSDCTLVEGANYSTQAVVDITDEEDSVLYVPIGGDSYTIDWGTDRKITSVEICHPTAAVDATYFVGTEESVTTALDEITEADVGKTITAGCCEFTVNNFSMAAAGGGAVSYNKVTVNPVGNLVVREVGADETKNLVIVGGPVVNGMSTVTKEELEAAADNFIVRKEGSKIMVAGYTASDTKEAGDALIQWLKENAHA